MVGLLLIKYKNKGFLWKTFSAGIILERFRFPASGMPTSEMSGIEKFQHCAKHNLIICIKSSTYTAGADATVYVWLLGTYIICSKRNHLFTVASTPTMTMSVFMQRYRFVLGQCIYNELRIWQPFSPPICRPLDKICSQYRDIFIQF